MTERVDLLIFDLDGTLIDSQLDLANSVNAARAHLGLGPIPNEEVYGYVGNGAPVLIQRALGSEASEADVERALQFFLGYYREHMLDHTRLYPGAREALGQLKDEGVLLAVLTNKPVRFSRELMSGLGVGEHFERIYGGNSFPEKKPHPIGIDTLLAELEVERGRAMMVGDSGVDVLTARHAGIRVCGVSFGFHPHTFEEHPPDFVVHHMQELAAAVIESRRA